MLAAEGLQQNVASMLSQNKKMSRNCLTGGLNFLHLAAQTEQTKVWTLLLDRKADFVFDREQLWCGEVNSRTDALSEETLEDEVLGLTETKTKYERLTRLHLAAIAHHSAAGLFLERDYRTLSLKVNKFFLDPAHLLCHQY